MRAPVRIVHGHRVIELADGQDWCLGCGAEPSPVIECRPGAARCVYGCGFPADVNDRGLRSCLAPECMRSRQEAV